MRVLLHLGLSYFSDGMASYIIDIWKDGEMVHSIAGKWTEDEARRLTMYYLGYYRAHHAQLLCEAAEEERPGETDLICEVVAPSGAARGETILW